jgi:hypothetical protein
MSSPGESERPASTFLTNYAHVLTSTSSTSSSATTRWPRIASLDTGTSMFFDHHDPAMVTWLGGRRVD